MLVPAAEHDAFVAFARSASLTLAPGTFADRPSQERAAPAAVPDLQAPQAPPRPLTSFVGRVREIQAASMLLRRHDVALVTLSGPPGAGKTRLSLAIAQHIGDDFTDGVCFVPLAPINDAGMVLPAIAQALGLPETPSRSPLQLVQQNLRDRRMLLILDNFEQVVSAGPQLAELLALAPHTKALVSSRAVLKVYGEHEFPVPSLSVPPLKPLPPLEAVSTYSAVQLFMQRAQAVRPGITLNHANAEAIAGICAALDGLPLAIEMAAARMKWNEPEALLSQLRQHLSSLSNAVRNLPPRQQTLRGAIDWSYDLLDAGEQDTLNWLSIFVGGCTLEAAQGVIGDADLEGLLESLVEKSLVQIISQAGEASRFTLLEMVRDYAREKLAGAGEWTRAREQHLVWFVRWVAIAASEMAGAQQAAWYRRLEADHDNLRAAADWALESRQANLGLRLASPLWQFWVARGHQQEWLERLTHLLSLPEAVPADGSEAMLRVKALHSAGFTHWHQKNYAAARALLEEAYALDALVDDARTRAISLRYLGLVSSGEHDDAAARDWLEQSLEILRSLNDSYEVAWSLTMLGDISLRQAEDARAQTQYSESASLLGALGNKTLRAYVLRRLGQLALRRAEPAAAVSLYRESLATNAELHDRRAIAATLIGFSVSTHDVYGMLEI